MTAMKNETLFHRDGALRRSGQDGKDGQGNALPLPYRTRSVGMHTFAAILITLMLAACGVAHDPTPMPPPVFPTHHTDPATPIPLALTPVLSPEPLPQILPMPGAQSSKAIALNGETLVTVNSDSATVTLIDLTSGEMTEVIVGDDPRTVVITPDGVYALVTLRGDNALAVVDIAQGQMVARHPAGHMPYGVVTNGETAYVSAFGSDQIVVIDLRDGDITHRLDVPDAPAGLALAGDSLLVTHFYTGHVTLIRTHPAPEVVGTFEAERDGVISQVIVVAPDGQWAYIPQMRTGLALISLQYMQDWFPVISVLDVPTMTGNRDARITVSMVGDYAANMPFDAAFTEDGSLLYTVLAGNDVVVGVDIHRSVIVARIPVGANPRGIVIDGQTAYVLNALDGTVSVIDLATNVIIRTLTVTQIPLDPQILRGKILFHSAASPRLSDDAISCATCHFDGGADARTWINFRSGPRNTPALGGLADTPPYNWAGDMDELHDTIEDQIRHVMLGRGLIDGPFDAVTRTVDAGRSDDLDALVAYVATFEPWPSPYPNGDGMNGDGMNGDGTLTESAQRGMALFMSGSPNCSCHAPPLYTDLLQHNIPDAGFSLEVFEHFDTPTLRGVWATAPYLHDGVAQTLEELLTRTDPAHSIAGQLTEQQLRDLIAFLLSL